MVYVRAGVCLHGRAPCSIVCTQIDNVALQCPQLTADMQSDCEASGHKTFVASMVGHIHPPTVAAAKVSKEINEALKTTFSCR